MNNLFTEVRLIGKIKEGQKLDTSGNKLSVYTNTWRNWLLRNWHYDGRDEGIRRLKDIFRQLLDILAAESQKPSNKRTLYTMINNARELKLSIYGIENLIKTYSNSPTTIASLEGIVQNYIIISYNIVLDSIPQHDRPADILEDIVFQGNILFKSTDHSKVASHEILLD